MNSYFDAWPYLLLLLLYGNPLKINTFCQVFVINDAHSRAQVRQNYEIKSFNAFICVYTLDFLEKPVRLSENFVNLWGDIVKNKIFC